MRISDWSSDVCSSDLYGRFSLENLPISGNTLGWAAVAVPVVGFIIIGFMARYGSEKIRGHGIPEAMEAILIGKSRIQPKVAVLKPLSSAVSIGTGGPFGAEEIGRASWRERVCQYVSIAVVAVSIKKKK